MKNITCILLQRPERDALVRCQSFIGIGANSPEERKEVFERSWNALLQRHEVLTYEVINRAVDVAMRSAERLQYEQHREYWLDSLEHEPSEQGNRMIEVITESRAQMAVDLAAALTVLMTALSATTPRPTRDDLEEEEEED